MACLSNHYKSALVIDHDENQRNLIAYCAYIYNIGYIETASSIQEGISKINCTFDLVFTASHFSEELCMPIVRACRMITPVPKLVVMISRIQLKELIEFILEEIDAYIELPTNYHNFRRCLNSLPHRKSFFESICRAQVGRIDFIEAQRLLRREMFHEALRQSSGNRTRTARLLGVSRRYVQSLINTY